MLPEIALVEVEPARVRRLLRKLLYRIADLEEDAAPLPSSLDNCLGAARKHLGGSRKYVADHQQRLAGCRGSGAKAPPAHPFEHLLKKRLPRPPRYTYKRRKCNASASSSDIVDGTKPLQRSASLSSLSDTEVPLDQDPAQWLTTPRKRHRRRSSASTHSVDTSSVTAMETRSQSFSSRLETLIVPADSLPTRRFQSMHLFSCMVNLGETLWLGGLSDNPDRQTRVLPLKIKAAFGLGEAIALSDGSDDLDYLDEMYCSLPPLLVRFVLWQHAVSLCHLRIPQYVDTLFESLWHVGAFAQLQWLIESRLAHLTQSGDLLTPTAIAPLYLRAIDIGTEHWLVTNMLRQLATDSAGTLPSRGIGNDALWLQFVSGGVSPTDNSPADYEGRSSAYSNTTALASDQSGDSNGLTPSRYAKWVARISNTVQSMRILSTALVQAIAALAANGARRTDFLTPDSSLADDTVPGCTSRPPAALEAVRSICAIMLTKLCSAEPMPASAAQMTHGCLLKCLSAFAVVTEIGSLDTEPRGPQGTVLNPGQAVYDACLICQMQLTLLTLRLHQQGTLASSLLTHDTGSLAATCRRLFDTLCDKRRLGVLIQQTPDPGPNSSKRSAFVARLNSLAERMHGPETLSTLSARMLETLILPLATVGAPPMLFYELAQIVGDIGKRKVAKAIIRLTLSRFDAIWARHLECTAWQQDWCRAQSTQCAAFVESSQTDCGIADAARVRLEGLLGELEQRTTKSKTSICKKSADNAIIPEDELGLLLSCRRRNTKRVCPSL